MQRSKESKRAFRVNGAVPFQSIRAVSKMCVSFVPRDAHNAERGIATLILSVRLSVHPSICLSVALRHRAHIGWVTSKVITRIIPQI